MVLNATFNIISWQSVLLVEETGVPGENRRPVASHWQTKASMFLKITKEDFEDTKVAIRIRKTSIKNLTY
jgi:hypothetical protein